MVITGGKAIGTIGFKRGRVFPSLKRSERNSRGFGGQESGDYAPIKIMGRSHRVSLPDGQIDVARHVKPSRSLDSGTQSLVCFWNNVLTAPKALGPPDARVRSGSKQSRRSLRP